MIDERPDFLPTLHNMDADQLRQCVAHAAGLLAQKDGWGGASETFRNITRALDQNRVLAARGRQ